MNFWIVQQKVHVPKPIHIHVKRYTGSQVNTTSPIDCSLKKNKTKNIKNKTEKSFSPIGSTIHPPIGDRILKTFDNLNSTITWLSNDCLMTELKKNTTNPFGCSMKKVKTKNIKN